MSLLDNILKMENGTLGMETNYINTMRPDAMLAQTSTIQHSFALLVDLLE